ncbi:hypothetical protein [Rhodobacter calidifons]|uniref:AAA+ ATPase domain-containing protein n=1 Tax=Rhodobacter calidifons TaxID=2715277 RepID=A0ABX0GAS8_9RHOB|nr:hypothetical protein [Rhodobacter calidifons]NHB78231.1 hypothetical protein [Rhodobacter calidifons]
MSQAPKKDVKAEQSGSSPVGRGGAGTYIEGQLGAYYLLQMLAGSDARGLPNARIERVQLQGENEGYALDDLIVHGVSDKGTALLEIQSKRTIRFSPKDPIFKGVCEQIVRSNPAQKPTDRHLLAVATQRTSYSISGPYQDMLEWAHRAESGVQFFARLALPGVASEEMRSFAKAFRSNLVAYGVADEDEAVWAIIRRFMILEFDFESAAPEAKAHALTLARQVLAPDDATRAEALWSNLIEIVIETGKAGGSITRQALIERLTSRGFHLAGGQNFALSRAKLAEMSRHALSEIGTKVGGVNLPRLGAFADLETARNKHRFIEITGKPGVGKSSVLRHLAERIGREGHVIVLDPVGTPDGGWSALAQRLDMRGTAKNFLWDLAAGGGGVLFIDGLEMFTSVERRRTVNDLLREIADVPSFSVVVSRRPDVGVEDTDWVAQDALAKLGTPCQVVVDELNDDEVEALSTAAPELRTLLSRDHPAASIARNLYRLAQLLKVPSSADIRTEAALADRWWKSADGAKPDDVRPSQRLLAELAEAALAGQDLVEASTDTPARAHLLRRLTLSEPRRDRLSFYHDVLRDWAIGARLNEDITLLDSVDLSVPPSPRVARGIEFAGRFALEKGPDGSNWTALLGALSRPGAHDAWRRQALMAIVRSELSSQLLNRGRAALLADGGALLVEICTAIVATETISAASAFKQIAAKGVELPVEAPGSLRIATTLSAPTVLMWCTVNASEIPMQAIAAIVKLAEVQSLTMMSVRELGRATAKMLFGWLMQLDLRDTNITIAGAGDAPRLVRQSRITMIEDLRTMALLMASHAPDDSKAYLTAAADENNHYKVKAIRPFSKVLVGVAPFELAALIKASLIEQPRRGHSQRDSLGRAFGFADTGYMPASPAQSPFLDLLDANPEVGLDLIRTLVDAAVEHKTGRKKAGTNGFTISIDGKPRFFPWVRTYFWSRPMQAHEYSAASGLMALEAWSQERLDRGEDVDAVLRDIFGPEGSCAAYLLIVLDVLLSHWPATRDALVPFVANPNLLANDRTRLTLERLGGAMILQKEPRGRVMLADLAKRQSRSISLERLIPYYLSEDDPGQKVRALLAEAVNETGSYSDEADFGDPAFMGSYALNMLDQANWVEVEGGFAYKSPPAEAEHLERLEARRQAHERSSTIEARIQLAISDPAKGSPDLAREAVDYAAGDLPDYSDTDHLKSRSTRLISTAMLVARDGEDALLDEHEDWVRTVIATALAEEVDRYGSNERLDFHRPAQGICSLIHLWRRRQLVSDRNHLLRTVGRQDHAAVIAITAARESISEINPQLIKAAMRIAFTSCRWRWHPHDEDASTRETYEKEKAGQDADAVAAEIAWLDGGLEPNWPDLPEETPSFSRQPLAILSPSGSRIEIKHDDAPFRRSSREAIVRVDDQELAKWVSLLNVEASALPSWYGEIVDAYALWSARLNGHGYSADAELNQTPDAWNHQFYSLAASALMDDAQGRFEFILQPILELPDRSFCDVAETLIHAADVRYFNESNRPSDRALALRQRLVTRTLALDRWSWDRRRGDLGIDIETGPTIGMLLMNLHNSFSGTKTYLVPAVFDRVDPLLETVRPMMRGGPTAFIALCTMNTLNVAPTARHLDFLMFAVETWLEVTNGDSAMWNELGIGRKIAEWCEAAAAEDPSLYRQVHPSRSRIDAILGRLVSLGVSEAHELELQIQAETR